MIYPAERIVRGQDLALFELDVPSATVTPLLPGRRPAGGPWVLLMDGDSRHFWASTSLAILRAFAQRRANRYNAIVDGRIYGRALARRIHVYPREQDKEEPSTPGARI